jgi:hypothetical protein
MRTSKRFFTTAGYLAVCFLPVACEKKFNPADGAAPPPNVSETSNTGVVNVEKPERFSLVTAKRIDAPAQLNVTGSVNPDINREVPVISLASGRVVDIRTRLDDNVKKGQLLIKVQSPDITNAFDTYIKARNDEILANKAYVRTMAPFRLAHLSRLRIPKMTPRQISSLPMSNSIPLVLTRITPPASSTCMRPSPGSSSRNTSPMPQRPA